MKYFIPFKEELSLVQKANIRSFFCPKCGKEKTMYESRRKKSLCNKCKMK